MTKDRERSKNQILNCAITLCENQSFNKYLSLSYEAFSLSTSYLPALKKDFSKHYSTDVINSFPFVQYSLVSIMSSTRINEDIDIYDNTIPFYDLIYPIAKGIASRLFNEYKELIWFSSYIDQAIEELIKELSEYLSPSLFELFSKTLPFGISVQRFYQDTQKNDKHSKQYYNKFVKETLSSYFSDVIISFPVIIYLLGHTIFTWHHRHIEMLDRIRLHCHTIFGLPYSSIYSLSFVKDTCGDNHNFHRRSYVLSCLSDTYSEYRICYKPRSVENDQFFSTTSEQLFCKIVDSSLRLPKVYNYGSYGFTEYIHASNQENQECFASLRRDGMWLFILWLFGFTDCTFENFVFDGSQHLIIDFETAFTGYFAFLKSHNSSTVLTPRALIALSSTRTTMLPRWNLVVDDRVDIDVSCFGNRKESSLLNQPLWMHINSDFMIYAESHKLKKASVNSDNLSDSLITTYNRIKLIVDGFNHAYTQLYDHFKSIQNIISHNSNLGSRFIFRDTASYARLLLDIVSPKSLSNPSNFVESLNKLDGIKLDHPSNDFINWIIPLERIQLFNLDIPYFYTDVNALSLKCCFDTYYKFNLIYRSGSDFVTSIIDNQSIFALQPLLIETSIFSTYGSSYCPMRYFPSKKNIEGLEYNFMDIWKKSIDSSFLYFSNVASPFLLSMYSGSSRKDVQIENLGPNFFSGTIGIYYATIIFNKYITESPNSFDYVNMKNLFLDSLENYQPMPSLQYSNCGLNDIAGFYYGLNLISLLVKDNQMLSSYSINNSLSKTTLRQLYNSESLKPDLFSGVAGSIIAVLSTNSQYDEEQFNILINILLTFQREDGRFLSKRTCNDILPLGLAHGVHGVLLCLLHIYSVKQSSEVLNSIHRIVEAYQLTRLDIVKSFELNLSWCSGFSGHLVVLSYLSELIPEYSFDAYTKISTLVDSCNLKKQSDPYFCCGLSGIYASLIYLFAKNNQYISKNLQDWLNHMKIYIIDLYAKRLSTSNYDLMKPCLLDGFSIFPLLASSTTDLNYIETLLLFKKR